MEVITINSFLFQGNDSTKAEIWLSPDDTLLFSLDGSSHTSVESLRLDEKVEFDGGVLQKMRDNLLLVQLQMGIGIKVRVRALNHSSMGESVLL